MSVQTFIEAVVGERDGFILSEPWRLSEESLSVIVPIIRESDEERDYITLAEAGDIKVEDTGQIDYVYIKNNEDKPVLISRGEIFRGKTQERVAVHGYVIQPHQGVRVAVRCIHHTKGINPGTKMKYGGRVPNGINLSDQQSTWNSIHSYNSDYCGKESFYNSVYMVQTTTVVNTSDSHSRGFAETHQNISASDDLVGTLDDMSSMIKEMMKKIPPIDNQVGAVFIQENQVNGMDIYNLTDSWKAVKDDIVAKEGSSFLKKEDGNIFEFKPDKVKQLLEKKLKSKFEEKQIFETKEYRIIEFREITDDKSKLRGEVVELLGKIIHLTMYRN